MIVLGMIGSLLIFYSPIGGRRPSCCLVVFICFGLLIFGGMGAALGTYFALGTYSTPFENRLVCSDVDCNNINIFNNNNNNNNINNNTLLLWYNASSLAYPISNFSVNGVVSNIYNTTFTPILKWENRSVSGSFLFYDVCIENPYQPNVTRYYTCISCCCCCCYSCYLFVLVVFFFFFFFVFFFFFFFLFVVFYSNCFVEYDAYSSPCYASSRQIAFLPLMSNDPFVQQLRALTGNPNAIPVKYLFFLLLIFCLILLLLIICCCCALVLVLLVLLLVYTIYRRNEGIQG